MRYYDITIRNHDTGRIIRPKPFQALNLPSTYTSYVNGKNLPGALNIEAQITAYEFGRPLQGSWVRIWGVSLEEISQAANLNDCDIVIKAGMQKGLPLANPKQNGVIATGRIYRAFGNWENLDKTLEIILMPTDTKPLNFSFNWLKNTSLSDAIKATLSIALPDYKQKIVISDSLRMSGSMVGVYDKIEDFSTAINRLTQLPQFAGIKTQSGGKYQGVRIFKEDKTVFVTDQTGDISNNSESNPKVLSFQDFIGQPTWITPQQINFKCPVRADIGVGDFVKMPDRLNAPAVLTTQGAAIPGNTPAGDELSFKGTFFIQKVFHFLHFRAPDASAWITSFDAVFNAGAPSKGSSNSSIISRAFNAPTGTTVTR